MQSITFKTKSWLSHLETESSKNRACLYQPQRPGRDLWFYWISHPKKIFTLGGDDAFLTTRAMHGVFVENVANKNVFFLSWAKLTVLLKASKNKMGKIKNYTSLKMVKVFILSGDVRRWVITIKEKGPLGRTWFRLPQAFSRWSFWKPRSISMRGREKSLRRERKKSWNRYNSTDQRQNALH